MGPHRKETDDDMTTLKLTACLAAALAASAAAAALPAAPSLKPNLIYASRVVSTQDAETLQKALRAAEDRNWSAVRRYRQEARAPVVSDLALWLMATPSGALLSFDELDQATQRLADWPLSAAVRRNAEEKIATSALSPEARIAWLEASGPISGPGLIALAGAYRATGQTDKANDAVRRAWRSYRLDRDLSGAVLRRFGGVLTQDDHRARADYLLWTDQRTAARRLQSELTADHRALVDARIALGARQRGVDAKVEAVPAALQNHPGLLYDRARWRRRSGLSSATRELLVRIDGADAPEAGRNRLWDERRIALRAALRDREYTDAYALAAPHGLSRGVDFAEAEWMAGWLALRKLGDADLALRHFTALREGVSTPISLARADYWRGRALEALGRAEEAETAFAAAAAYDFVFYGQLAAERDQTRAIVLPAAAAPTDADRAAFEGRPLVKAMRLLAEAGEEQLFRRFAYHLDDQLTSIADHQLLSQIALDYNRPEVGVRGAKAGLAKGLVVADAAYPIIDYTLQRPARVESAFIHALSRQESELNPRAISHANARGMMQLLPSTARVQARREGLPYRVSWLTDDPDYNITLGASHLDDLLHQFNGSYIMTAAAYNAGASRPRRWINEYGDPRRGEIDPIDWIESIPISETRNYVQRVLENIQVYRHRLTGEAQPIRLSEDIARGRLR